MDLPTGHTLRDESNPRFPESHQWGVHDHAGKRIGYISTVHYHGVGHTIHTINIEPGHTRQGLGGHVVRAVAKHLGGLSSDPQGNTTPAAHGMWKKLGAKQVPTDKNTKGFHWHIKESTSMTFKQFIAEGREHKLTHLEHVEDRALHSREGAEHALSALRGVGDALEGSPGPRITTKFDGSPSLLFGHHPETGKFFVATKAGLSKTPKLNYTPEDIEKNHVLGLHDKLKSALENLPKVTPKGGIFQGDFMYHSDTMHEGPKHYNFTPNTLMYSVKKDTPEGKKIKQARVGVAVHTQYHGHDMENMKASFNPQLSKFKEHKDVHIINPEVSIEKAGKGAHATALKKAEQAYLDTKPDAWDVTAGHHAHLQAYINHTSAHGVKPTTPGLKQFMKTRFQKEAEKLTTDRGKLNKMKALVDHHAHIDQHHDSYESLLNLHHALGEAKKAMLPALNKHNPYETSVKGKPVESGEGFVVHHHDVPSKLVDREKFTKANMEAHKTNEEVLTEGGNLQIGEHKASPVDPKFRKDVGLALSAVHTTFHKEHNGHLFGQKAKALHNGSAFSGSSHAFIHGHMKEPAGDIDVMTNADHMHKLKDHLEHQKHFGPYHVVGVKKQGKEIHALMKHKKTGAIHQFDFESTRYNPQSHEPTDAEKFAHGSDPTDRAMGIKGAHHKILLHAVAHSQGKKFSITHGLRRKETEGDEEGMRDPHNIAHSLFGTMKGDIHSFRGVTQMIKNHIDPKQHEAIVNKFKDSLQKLKLDHGPAIKHLQTELKPK